MTELATLGLSIRSDGVVVATDRLKDFEGAGRRAEDVTGSLARMAAKAGAVLAGAFSIRALQQYADAWSDMQSRVGAAVKDMEAAPALMQRMVDLANASYSPLEQTVEVYTRNVGVLRDLGVAASGAADFTESLNHMLVITATRGERAASVQNALSKAMATGKLQADGLETVLANGGRVAEALANELGTTVSGLRSMSSEGKITGEVIKNALLNSLEDVREEASKMPATIGDAFTRIQTNTTALVGTLDQAWGISGLVAEQLLGMADGIRASADTYLRLGNIVASVVGPAFDLVSASLNAITTAAPIAVAAVAGFYAPAMVGGLWATATALVTGVAGGIKAVTLAMMANPIGLLIGGLALGVTAAFMFRDEIKQAIGIDVVEVFRDGANAVIGAMVGAVNASMTAWEVFPDFMAGLGARAWNSFLEGFEGSAVSWTNPFTGETFDLLNIDLSAFKKDTGGAGGAAVEAVLGAYNSAQGVDYVGELASKLGEAWTNAEGAGGAIGALAAQLDGGAGAGGTAGGLAGSASAANDNIKKLAEDGLAKVGQFGQQVLSTLSSGFAEMFKGVITGTKSAGEALSGLIAKLGDLLANQAFNMIFGVGGGAMGGGGLFGWLGGLFGFANGGYTGNTGRSSVAGVVHGGEYVFSAPAVDRIGLGNLEGMHRSARGYQTGGYVTPAAFAPASISNQLTIRTISEVRNGNLVPVMTEVAGEVAGQRIAQASPAIVGASVTQSNKSAPAAVAKYQQDRGNSDYRVA